MLEELWNANFGKNPVFHFRNGTGTAAVFAGGLGLLGGLGVTMALYNPRGLWQLGVYFALLSFFHLSEFFCVSIFNPKMLSTDCK